MILYYWSFVVGQHRICGETIQRGEGLLHSWRSRRCDCCTWRFNGHHEYGHIIKVNSITMVFVLVASGLHIWFLHFSLFFNLVCLLASITLSMFKSFHFCCLKWLLITFYCVSLWTSIFTTRKLFPIYNIINLEICNSIGLIYTSPLNKFK